jgi:hypothetical protein
MAKSNSNMVITGYKVDPTTQQITSLEVNGETIETGSDPVLISKTINVTSLSDMEYVSYGDRYYVGDSISKHPGKDGFKSFGVYVNANLFGGAPTLKQVTLDGMMTVQALIENTDATETQGYIDTFSGVLYINSNGTLTKTDYTVTASESGHKIVTIGYTPYIQIKLGWE